MIAPSSEDSRTTRTSLVYPTVVGAGATIAGVLMLIETFFYFGHQGTSVATAAMVLGAILIVSPVLALLASHLAHNKGRVKILSSTSPMVTVDVPRDRLSQQVAEEIRRQLAAGFANLSQAEGSRPPGSTAVPSSIAGGNAVGSVS